MKYKSLIILFYIYWKPKYRNLVILILIFFLTSGDWKPLNNTFIFEFLIFNFSFWRGFARGKKNHSGPVQREEIDVHKTYVSLVWEEEEEWICFRRMDLMDLLPRNGFDGFASEEWIWRICFRRSLRVFGASDQSRILDFF